ncbi:MAG: amino acid adenylation domain-containing protein [Candidatus Eremiobacteraeota bacterium]|nr:amino acid adenylation domain-containing protein [Candidatus Eremiobacteraeota bacterium]
MIELRGAPGAQCFPCTQAQQRFWFEERLHPGNPGLNVAVRWRLEGDVSTAILEEAWRRVIERHQTLRTSFETVDGEPIALVAASVPFSIAVIDLRALPEEDVPAEVDRHSDREAHRPFDLSRAPLVRVTRLVLHRSVSVLLVTAHHTVCDGWSIGILAREMGEICESLGNGREPNLPILPTTYADVARFEREERNADSYAETSARRCLDGYKQFELMPDRPRPTVQTSNGAIASILLGRELTDALADLSRREGCTLFMTAYAALLVVLHRHSGETDIALGTQVHGRDDVALEDLVGCFINTIALRCNLSGNPRFSELLARARDAVLESVEARSLPLERLIALANPKRDPSRNALFSTNFIFQRSFIRNATYGTFRLVDMPSRSAGALYDLNFFMVERPEGWRASCEYNVDLFDHQTVTALLERFVLVLRSIARDPSQCIAAIPILTEEDERAIAAPNPSRSPYPADQTVVDLFEREAMRHPDATAVVSADESVTYAQLRDRSRRLAHVLRTRLGTAGLRIGVLVDRSAELVIALLGVLGSGNTYVPLDPDHPADRIRFIAEDAGLAAIVTTRALRGHVAYLRVPTVTVDARGPRRARFDAVERARADDAAYVVYTSGSTGTPKGVAVRHRSLVNLLWSMRARPGITDRDVLVAVTTVSFDIAALELFGPLVCGATLVIAKECETNDGETLLRILRRYGATVLQATPATWRLLLDAGWQGRPALRMLCGGEPLVRGFADRLLLHGTELWNLYGPTETTIWSSVQRVERESTPVSIGRPIANTTFHVLDTQGRVVPPGVPGELHIGGDGVALGYIGQPEMTQARFVANPFGDSGDARLYRTGDLVRLRADGTFEFLGRLDRQVKVRGFRIELEEIESVLLRQPDVAEAAVIIANEGRDDAGLCAYVVRRFSAGDDVRWMRGLRERIAAFLPAYMVPARIVALDALPRTPNGKLDRPRLPAEVLAGEEPRLSDEPRTPTERAVTGVVRDVLHRNDVGRLDDLFALGFHSLLAVRLQARIAAAIGTMLPLRTLFEEPTVAALAARIDAIAGRPMHDEHGTIVSYNTSGTRTPFFFFHSDLYAGGRYCATLAAAAGDDQPLHAVAPHGTAGLASLTTIEAMARDYLPRLRAERPRGPYLLGGFCVGGLVAFEVARLLRAEGETVEQLLLINASPLPRRRYPFIDQLVCAAARCKVLPARVRESLAYNIARLGAALALGPAVTARFGMGRLRALLQMQPGTCSAPEVGHHGKDDDNENGFVHLSAALTYHPARYDGTVTLLWSSEQRAAVCEPSAGWGAVANGIRLISLAGGHVNGLRDRIGELAATLSSVLAEPPE